MGDDMTEDKPTYHTDNVPTMTIIEYRVLCYIVKHKREHDGCPPVVREIMEACDISSTSLVDYYLKSLAAAGFIRLLAGKARGLEVVGGRWTYSEPAQMNR